MPKRKKRKKKRSSRIGLLLLVFMAIALFFAYKKFFYQERHAVKISNLPELPEGFKSYGIDISHHQDVIDWEQFKTHNDSTIQFVYCKVTEGLELIDRQWQNNHKSLYVLKIPHGGYHFFRPKVSAEIQAKHFLANYKHTENELPPALDVETEGRSDAELISNMKIWLAMVEVATGKRPIIYTSYHFYSTKFKDQFPNHKFWVANYSNKSHRFLDEQIIHWQFSESGKIPGIKGFVDLNYSKIEF